ncbi:MAG: hypothetical protein GX489_00625 [Firmicutes bacterium]|nr:hypothetical protein [Bacillota bacterium]
MVVAYEGKEEQGRRRTLKQRRVAAGLRDGQSIWEEASAHFARTRDMSALEKVSIGGDGAEWVKTGKDYFSHATLQLDPFHLWRNIIKALGFDTKSASRLAVAINQGTLQDVQEILDSAAKKVRGQSASALLILRSISATIGPEYKQLTLVLAWALSRARTGIFFVPG